VILLKPVFTYISRETENLGLPPRRVGLKEIWLFENIVGFQYDGYINFRPNVEFSKFRNPSGLLTEMILEFVS
jgi:hypothetical protein